MNPDYYRAPVHEMNCSNCETTIKHGPEVVESAKSNLAIRCAYCLRMFCLKCARQHFEPEWIKDAIDAVKRSSPPGTSVNVETSAKGQSRKTLITLEINEQWSE